MPAIDKRREWAAAAACQIINLHWDKDVPVHIAYAEIEKVILAALRTAATEMRHDMTEPSQN
jgi:hypothetical protein